MGARLHTQAKTRVIATPSFSPVRAGLLQRRTIDQAEPATVPPIVHKVLRSSGRPLDLETRAFMESRFGHDFSRVPVRTGVPMMIQAKLTIGQPGDKYEQEADRVADLVMRVPEPHVQRQVEPREEAEEERDFIQTKPASGQTHRLGPSLESHFDAVRGGGQSLTESERHFFEPRFNYDFSQVRVHTDAWAAEMARAVNARAFTMGRNVVFGAGQYKLGTVAGKRLLAHELTHVIQQKRMNGAYIQRKESRLRDFEKTDPATLSDDEIKKTHEYKAFMNPDSVWQKNLKVTAEEALLACQLILKAIQDGKEVNWKEDARGFVLAARKQLGAAMKSEERETKSEKKKETENGWVKDKGGDLYYKTYEEAERRMKVLKEEGKWAEYKITSFKLKGRTYYLVEMRGKKPEPPKEKKGTKPEVKKPKTEKVEKEPKKEQKEAKPKKPEFVKFTFDDGPRAGTGTILSTLNQHSIKAGFFITGPANGSKMDKVQSIIDAKHVVGNHTWDHSHKAEMFKKLHDYILKRNKHQMTYWRGPGGSTTGLTKIAKQLGYGPHTHWEFDSLDYKGLTAKQIVEKRIMKGPKGRGPKGVLLMHDRHAAKILPALINRLTAENITIKDFP